MLIKVACECRCSPLTWTRIPLSCMLPGLLGLKIRMPLMLQSLECWVIPRRCLLSFKLMFFMNIHGNWLIIVTALFCGISGKSRNQWGAFLALQSSGQAHSNHLHWCPRQLAQKQQGCSWASEGFTITFLVLQNHEITFLIEHNIYEPTDIWLTKFMYVRLLSSVDSRERFCKRLIKSLMSMLTVVCVHWVFHARWIKCIKILHAMNSLLKNKMII